MKITYKYDDGTKVTIKAPEEIIHALDAELYGIMDIDNNCSLYPHLRELWFNLVGEQDAE